MQWWLYILFGFTCFRKPEDLQIWAQSELQEPGPQPADVFLGGTKWCSLFLYLTFRNVFENFGKTIARLPILWLRVWQEHFGNRHGEVDVSHAEKILRAKRVCFDARADLPKLGFVSVNKPLLTALYQVAFKVAKSKKLHTIAKELVKPRALDMAATIHANGTRKKLELVPLSNNVVQKRIADLSLDIWNKLSHMWRLVPRNLPPTRRDYRCFELQSTYSTDGVCPWWDYEGEVPFLWRTENNHQSKRCVSVCERLIYKTWIGYSKYYLCVHWCTPAMHGK